MHTEASVTESFVLKGFKAMVRKREMTTVSKCILIPETPTVNFHNFW